ACAAPDGAAECDANAGLGSETLAVAKVEGVLPLSAPRARTRETVTAQIPHKSPKSPLVSPPVPLSQRLRRSRWRSGVRRKRGTGG
ncbi:hypothetical protein, partial [Mobiluncus mulieris]|uniref:hypothetical protein n=1 Tax=Mobiluncus mulieris TaxID=2052 RepID=UPI00242EEDA1